MNEYIRKNWQWLSSLVFGIGVFLFWYVKYYAVLSYNEQLQLFLFDSEYFVQRLKYPGGLSVYAGEFITQFYASFLAGAIILGILFVIVQRLVWRLAKAEGVTVDHYLLSFIPALFLLYSMGDENILSGYIVASIIAMGVSLWYSHIEQKKWQITFLIIAIPALFYVASAATYTFVGYTICRTIRREGISLETTGKSIVLALYTLGCILASYYLTPYPLANVAAGIGFYRFKNTFLLPQMVFTTLLFITPLVMASINNVKVKNIKKVRIAEMIICIISCFMIHWGYEPTKYRIIKYDYYLRTHNWDAIIELAKESPAISPMEVSTINFALAMKGELTERMFEFNQKNSEGLMPLFNREIAASIMANEIYFKLGMINTSQRLMFEAQEAIPNNQKSGRILRRLTETNLINGQYEVAKKYLHILEKTFAYRKWAKEMMTYLYDEEKINSHPLYGELRSFRVTEDFFYSDQEMDQMLGLLFVHNNNNQMALDYLLTLELLVKDLNHFYQYYPLTSKLQNYRFIPRVYQEALAYIWVKQNKNINNMPAGIDNRVKQALSQFAQIYTRDPNSPMLSQGYNASSYWNFLLVGKN